MSKDERFLSRWSQRKSAHRAGLPSPKRSRFGFAQAGRELADEEKRKTAPVAQGKAEHAPAPAKEAQVPDDAPPPKDLPTLESLTLDSDYARFLKADVPGPLRKAALRKLWTSDPALARMDPLDLHNLDYTFPKVPEVVTSLFQVGRGMVLPEDEAPKKQAEEIEAQQAPALPAAQSDPAPDTKIAHSEKDKEPG